MDTFRDGLARSVAKLFGLRGSPGIGVGSETALTALVDDMRFSYPICEHWFAHGTVGPVAAQLSQITLEMVPTLTPGTLCVVDNIVTSATAASNWRAGIIPTGTLVTSFQTSAHVRNGDHAAPIPGPTSPVLDSGLGLTVNANAQVGSFDTNAPQLLNQNITWGYLNNGCPAFWLQPGQTLVMENTVPNTQIAVHFSGRYYRAG